MDNILLEKLASKTIDSGSSFSFITAIIIIIILLLCCSSSAAAVFYNRKSDVNINVVGPATSTPSGVSSTSFSSRIGNAIGAPSVPSVVAPLVVPKMCSATGDWGGKTVKAGEKVSKICADGSTIFATCGTDGKFTDVPLCPSVPSVPSVVQQVVAPIITTTAPPTCTSSGDWGARTVKAGEKIERICLDGTVLSTICGPSGDFLNVPDCPKSSESPRYKDEMFGSKWGSGGKTAKLAAVKWCSDQGLYTVSSINDKGGFEFTATCSGDVPSDWSKRFSDESAKEINPSWNRNTAAEDNCRKKGFGGIDPGQFREGKFFDYSLKCTGAPVVAAPVTPPVVAAPVVAPKTCSASGDWGGKTVSPGEKVSKICADGSTIFATCGADGNFMNVPNCPSVPVFTASPTLSFSNLRNSALGKCADSNGSSIYFNACSFTNDFQNWSYENGLIKHKQSGKCLDSSGTSIYLSNCDPGNNSQKWNYDPASQTITHFLSKKVITTNGDNNTLVLEDNTSSVRNKWFFSGPLNLPALSIGQQLEASRIAEAARIAEASRIAEAARIAEASRIAEAARLAEAARQASTRTCTSDSLWGNQTVSAGGRISRTCPGGSTIFATCGTNGNFSDVQNCPVTNDSLNSPECLTNGSLFSPNRVFEARQGADGHFVIYKGSAVLWKTDKYGGEFSGGRLCMQSDGNLVNYRVGTQNPYWNSGTNGRGTGPYRATIQDDGNFVVYDSRNSVIWSTGTNGR